MPIATLHETDGLSATAFDLQSINDNMTGTLYVSSCPGFSKTDGANEERKAAHLAFLFDQGIHLVISLTPEDERSTLGVADMPERIKTAGIDWIEAPVVNFGTPDQDQMAQFKTMITAASSRLQSGQKVLIHCRGGTGRAGKAAAIILMGGGMSADLAISTLRDHRAGCVQTPEQEDFVRAYDGNL